MDSPKSLWAVRAYEDVGDRRATRGGWVVVGIYRTQLSALKVKRAIQNDFRRQYPFMDPQVVHPTQDVLSAYLEAGNVIYD